MRNRTTLCVDDETHVLSSLKRLLRNEDYNVVAANGGQEALDVMKKQPVHVVISDHRMPGMTGTELFQTVKKLYPDTVRVILSGYADINAVLQAINKGEVYRFLTKPWNDEELKVAIKQCIGQYDILQENQKLFAEVKAKNDELRRINESLEETVERRTESLRLSQEILEQLPVPVIGISEDGMVALVNDAMRKSFPSLEIMPGLDIDDILPSDITELLKTSKTGSFPLKLEKKDVSVRIAPLGKENSRRGSILIIESG